MGQGKRGSTDANLERGVGNASAVCADQPRRMVIWVTFCVMVPVAGVLAILDRHQHGLPFGKPYWPDVVRALAANVIFAGLALLTPPGSTCLLPGPIPGTSILPEYAPQIFVVVVYSISAALSQYCKVLRGDCAGLPVCGPPVASSDTSAQEPLLGPSGQSTARAADTIA